MGSVDILGASGEQPATLVGARRFAIHATQMVDVTVEWPDGRRESHRLGAESVDDSLEPGDAVLVQRVMAMITGVRRAVEG
ncbi:MAG: hypothetical protein H0V93_14255 [Euzebyales bacterium]|nr:hypothetical protein [Euzebyales bacterium]